YHGTNIVCGGSLMYSHNNHRFCSDDQSKQSLSDHRKLYWQIPSAAHGRIVNTVTLSHSPEQTETRSAGQRFTNQCRPTTLRVPERFRTQCHRGQIWRRQALLWIEPYFHMPSKDQ